MLKNKDKRARIRARWSEGNCIFLLLSDTSVFHTQEDAPCRGRQSCHCGQRRSRSFWETPYTRATRSSWNNLPGEAQRESNRRTYSGFRPRPPCSKAPCGRCPGEVDELTLNLSEDTAGGEMDSQLPPEQQTRFLLCWILKDKTQMLRQFAHHNAAESLVRDHGHKAMPQCRLLPCSLKNNKWIAFFPFPRSLALFA